MPPPIRRRAGRSGAARARRRANADAPAGDVIGRGLDLAPSAPAVEAAPKTIMVSALPIESAPVVSIWRRLIGMLASFGLVTPDAEARAHRQAMRATALVVASICPSRFDDWLDHTGAGSLVVGDGVRGVRVHHPYDLLSAFELALVLPDRLAAECRFLEAALVQMLRAYADAKAGGRVAGFKFNDRTRVHFADGMRGERFARTAQPNERLELLQSAIAGFYHGGWSYVCAVLRREKSSDNGVLFLQYCRAQWFLARVDHDGTVRATPDPARLPRRRAVRFLARRDRAVVERAVAEAEFADRVNQMLKAFPGD